MTREQLRAAKTAVDAGNNGAENNGLENVGERLQRLESMMRILLEENYQRSPQQRQQSVVDRTQPLQATDWDIEQQSVGDVGHLFRTESNRSSEGGGAQVLLDLGNKMVECYGVLVLGLSGISIDETWSARKRSKPDSKWVGGRYWLEKMSEWLVNTEAKPCMKGPQRMSYQTAG